MLELKGVTRVYAVGGAKQKALRGININFRKNEFAAILGPSGSGKTTLLNIIGGLDHYTSGDLIVNEVSTKRFRDRDWDTYRNHRIGFVFQSYNLIPHQTVLQNVKLALTLSGISKREATRRAKKALEKVGLKAHIDKKPGQLSGGQAQRVAIARALVNDPEILLADEPTGALDSETSVQIMELLKEVAKDRLVIMVTHNPELAKEYATRIIELKDGSITADSAPYNGKVDTSETAEIKQAKRKKTKMSFITALGLSLKNLLTKKGRTILVSFAGSIGIIGIALILAVSTGFQNYVDYIQDSTLSSYPLTFEESATDITGLFLGMNGEKPEGNNQKQVQESTLLTSMANSVGVNDLKSFKQYLTTNFSEVREDLSDVAYRYSIDPPIYTVDATDKLVQLNPSSLFTSLTGGSAMLGSYSSMTSVYKQITADEELFKKDYDIVAGRFPEKYNEMILELTNEDSISDFLVYSLGLRNTAELPEIVTKILNGESVQLDNTPMAFNYDDFMALDLRLIEPADLYTYNEKYDVFEDMSEDRAYMQGLYDRAEKLKIVGVAVASGNSLRSGGVGYLPELVAHISSYASETNVVKKQLASPDINVFSGAKFGEKDNDFDFGFADLVKVDNDKLQAAFGVKIDQSAITAKTSEYMQSIAASITADTSGIEDSFISGFDAVATGLKMVIPAPVVDPDDETKTIPGFSVDEITGITDNYLATLPDLMDHFKASYNRLLKTILGTYLQVYGTLPDPTVDYYDLALESIRGSAAFETAVTTAANALTEIQVKQAVLSKVGELTSYLTNTFANAFSVDTEAITGAFSLNFSEDELARVVSAMFTKTEATEKSNLAKLGYQNLDDPTFIEFYFASFDGKEHFLDFVDEYNSKMEVAGNKDKVIEYTDTTGVLMDSVKTIVDAVSYVLIAFVSISLIVSSIMIGVITYISVYERTKEIGILRAIGASKHNISSIFNAETFIVGLLSGIFGIGISYLCIPIINAILHGFVGDIPLNAYLDPKSAGILIIISVILTLIGGLIPARKASKKDPVEALRSE